MSICIHGKSIYEFSYPKSSSDLETILRKIDSYGYCPGGPECARTGFCSTKVATQDKDTKRWRHVDCPNVRPNTTDGLCPKCHTLFETFDRITRNNDRIIKGLTLQNASPEDVVKDRDTTIKSVNLELFKAQKQLDACFKEMKKTNYDDVMNELKKKKIPEIQVSLKTFS